MIEIIWNNKAVIKGEYIAFLLVLAFWISSILIAFTAGKNTNKKFVANANAIKPAWLNEPPE